MATYGSTTPRLTPSGTRRWPPRVTVKPGDTVVFETLEACANQITPKSKAAALAAMSFETIHPLTGPVFVGGAEPGDALEVEIIALSTRAGAGTRCIPGFGLLADDFTEPYLHHYQLTRADACSARTSSSPMSRSAA